MSWDKGRDVIEDLLERGHLERVPANEDEAAHLLDKGRAHLRTAAAVADDDPEIAAALPAAEAIVDAASRVLPQLTVSFPVSERRADLFTSSVQTSVRANGVDASRGW